MQEPNAVFKHIGGIRGFGVHRGLYRVLPRGVVDVSEAQIARPRRRVSCMYCSRRTISFTPRLAVGTPIKVAEADFLRPPPPRFIETCVYIYIYLQFSKFSTTRATEAG